MVTKQWKPDRSTSILSWTNIMAHEIKTIGHAWVYIGSGFVLCHPWVTHLNLFLQLLMLKQPCIERIAEHLG